MNVSAVRRAPVRFWVMSVAILVWNSLGALDYLMTNTRDPDYLTRFPAAMIDYLDAMPGWALGAWTLAVWGALGGSVLLVLRSRYAIYGFVLSLIGLGLSAIYQALSSMPPEMRTPGMMVVTAVIWIAAIGFAAFAAWYRKAGILR